jgi:hypothetical protein
MLTMQIENMVDATCDINGLMQMLGATCNTNYLMQFVGFTCNTNDLMKILDKVQQTIWLMIQ